MVFRNPVVLERPIVVDAITLIDDQSLGACPENTDKQLAVRFSCDLAGLRRCATYFYAGSRPVAEPPGE